MANNPNCPYPSETCEGCEMYDEEDDFCGQDRDEGGTGHGEISFSDADPGL